MATNHTTNYQLNLWEPGDSFLREEFNQNNRKLDVALGELAQQQEALEGKLGAVLLARYTTQAAQKELSFDWSSFDFTQFSSIALHAYDLTTTESASTVIGYFNGDRNVEHYGGELHLGTIGNFQGLGNLMRFHFSADIIGAVVECLYVSSDSVAMKREMGSGCTRPASGITAANLESLTLRSSSGDFQAGARFYLYGYPKGT